MGNVCWHISRAITDIDSERHDWLLWRTAGGSRASSILLLLFAEALDLLLLRWRCCPGLLVSRHFACSRSMNSTANFEITIEKCLSLSTRQVHCCTSSNTTTCLLHISLRLQQELCTHEVYHVPFASSCRSPDNNKAMQGLLRDFDVVWGCRWFRLDMQEWRLQS